MTKEQIINKIYQTFVIDKAPRSTLGSGVCCYGNPDNSIGCAVACLMDQDTRIKLYDFECTHPDNDTSASCMLDAGIIPEQWLGHEELLEDLQKWHDYGTEAIPLNGEYRVNRLREIAGYHGVEVSW